MLPAVEPDVVEGQSEGVLLEELDGATDVVAVDVGQDEELEVAVLAVEPSDVLPDVMDGAVGATVDEQAMTGAAAAVGDEETVAVLRRQHLDVEGHRSAARGAHDGGGPHHILGSRMPHSRRARAVQPLAIHRS